MKHSPPDLRTRLALRLDEAAAWLSLAIEEQWDLPVGVDFEIASEWLEWLLNGKARGRLDTRTGRPVLYDAPGTSSNGEASCAGCHVFGDFDSLAWDLGTPDEGTLNNPNTALIVHPFGISFDDFPPM